jgi:hypothetical protein
VTGDAEAHEVTRTRIDAHEGKNPEKYVADSELIGVIGEQFFARTFGLPLDKRGLPRGDGGRDFIVQFPGRILTIDVKCARKPLYLFIKEKDIDTCADILVLCALDEPRVGPAQPRLVGWETRGMMSLMPVGTFGHPCPNHFRAASELRPICQLANLLGMRSAP